ncbi:hypothetical protein N8I74_02550 [Chitiniphilus purpureus]|uniref:Uncharacterized protein n=1 Tax=Chitiniphilus purpureus TaxID=2981137 RepID=A0ABY6DPG9_9NEIS|nr:hypothetical protein [Chitiniphilus sp. CD1]UXY15917.1 hypothetical protein N8I74_02550 [Chitiniphilus sp. CD1]
MLHVHHVPSMPENGGNHRTAIAACSIKYAVQEIGFSFAHPFLNVWIRSLPDVVSATTGAAPPVYMNGWFSACVAIAGMRAFCQADGIGRRLASTSLSNQDIQKTGGFC